MTAVSDEAVGPLRAPDRSWSTPMHRGRGSLCRAFYSDPLQTLSGNRSGYSASCWIPCPHTSECRSHQKMKTLMVATTAASNVDVAANVIGTTSASGPDAAVSTTMRELLTAVARMLAPP
jgi:hypothetical protein